MKSLKMTHLFFAFALTGTALTASAGDVNISNESDWSLTHLYISSVNQQEWGEDQLGDKVIGTGESFTLTGVPCGTYDVKLRDEDGDECEVADVDICGNGGWTIESDVLLACQGATAE